MGLDDFDLDSRWYTVPRKPKRHTIRFRGLYLDWQIGKDSWGEPSGDKYVISYFQIAKVIRDNGQCIRRVVLWRLHIAWGFVNGNSYFKEK